MPPGRTILAVSVGLGVLVAGSDVGAHPGGRLPAAAGDRSVTLAFTGETSVRGPLLARAQRPEGGYDITPMLAEVAPLVAGADLAVCHLETPVMPPGETVSTAAGDGAPAEIVGGLAATGFDRCSTASDHVLDRGVAGIDATVAAFAAAGLTQSGMARTPVEIEPQVLTVAGVGVAHLSYTFGYDGRAAPAGQEWRSALIDPARILADARLARRQGAQIVAVSLHWGRAGQAEVSPEQRALAEQLTADGSIDLVVGHHANVLQPIELINDRWVAFGLGHLVADSPAGVPWLAASQDSAVLAVPFTVDDAGVAQSGMPQVWPMWIDREAGWLVRDIGRTLQDPATPAGLREVLNGSLDRTTVVMGPFIAPSPAGAAPADT